MYFINKMGIFNCFVIDYFVKYPSLTGKLDFVCNPYLNIGLYLKGKNSFKIDNYFIQIIINFIFLQPNSVKSTYNRLILE